jgi:hypothetical protein
MMQHSLRKAWFGLDSAWMRSHKPVRSGSASFSIVVAKAMPEGAPARCLGFIPHLTQLGDGLQNFHCHVFFGENL